MYGLLKHGDFIEVVSITDFEKVYLPDEYRPEGLRKMMQTELLGNLLPSSYSISLIEVMPGQTKKEMLINRAKETNAAILVCGWHGRKGPKE